MGRLAYEKTGLMARDFQCLEVYPDSVESDEVGPGKQCHVVVNEMPFAGADKSEGEILYDF